MQSIHVVAGALVRGDQVLIAQRPPGKHMAGGWEFPGGKRQADEGSRAALVRELKEELGIEVQASEFVAECVHDYSDRRVQLELWRVTEFMGEPSACEGQPLRWVPLHQLSRADLLPADAPLVKALLKVCDGPQ